MAKNKGSKNELVASEQHPPVVQKELFPVIDKEVDGIDGDPDLKKRDYIFPWDFTKGVPPLSNFTWDLGWSVEFLEHVEKQYIPNYMEVFQKCRYVVCTAAPPGWGGHHHVNEQDYLYWIDKFRRYGFQFDNPMTQEMRKYSTMQEHSKGSSFMKRTGMFFERI